MQPSTSQIKFLILSITAILLLLVFIIITLLYLHQKRQLTYQKKIDSLKLEFERMLLTTQIEVQEQTFQHISAEIHDNINLSLTLVKLHLNTLDWSNINRIKNSISSSIEILGTSINDLNNLSKGISTEIIKSLGLIKALNHEILKIHKLDKLELSTEIIGEPAFLEIDKELVIFRVIQEALNNILKHSFAKKIVLKLIYETNWLIVQIQDDGIGFNQEDVSRLEGKAGIRNMRTRTKLFGGEFELDSAPAEGTKILIKIPYYAHRQN